jgi:hypothetical protein
MEGNFNFLAGEWTSRQRRLREVLKGSCRRCSGALVRTARVFASEEEYEGIPTICRDLWIRIAAPRGEVGAGVLDRRRRNVGNEPGRGVEPDSRIRRIDSSMCRSPAGRSHHR